MPTTPAHRQSGLTLVEILVALTILAVVLLPVMVGFAQALITTSQSSTATLASSLARQQLETLKAAGYSSAAAGQTTATADLAPGDGYFTLTTTITELVANDGSLKGLKRIEIVVRQTGSDYLLAALTTDISPVGV